MATPTSTRKKASMRFDGDGDWDKGGSDITPLRNRAPEETERFEYEGKVEMGMSMQWECDEDDALYAAKYIGIEGASGFTQSQEKDLKIAKNTEAGNGKGEVLRRATTCDGPDVRKVREYSAVPEMGVRVPEAGAVIANEVTAEGDVGSRAHNTDWGEKASRNAEIGQRASMQHESEYGCTTTLACTIEEVSLAEVFEEKRSGLRCLNCGNKRKLIKNGEMDSPQNPELICTSCMYRSAGGNVEALMEPEVGLSGRSSLVPDRRME